MQALLQKVGTLQQTWSLLGLQRPGPMDPQEAGDRGLGRGFQDALSLGKAGEVTLALVESGSLIEMVKVELVQSGAALLPIHCTNHQSW